MEDRRAPLAAVETLRGAYSRLQQKLTETQAQVELLVTQLRRSRAAQKAHAAQTMLETSTAQRKLRTLTAKVEEAEARNHASRTLLAIASTETLDERLATLERSDEVETLLLELKGKLPERLTGT